MAAQPIGPTNKSIKKIDSWSVWLSSMDHSFSVIWFLKNNYSCARPLSWLSGKTWVSRKVLITDTHCRCVVRETGHLPIYNSTGSDAPYNSRTVYRIFKKLCRLTFFLFANRVAIRGLIRLVFVLSSAPLHLFSWHSWFCEALSASCFLFLTETSYTHSIHFSLLHTSVSCSL